MINIREVFFYIQKVFLFIYEYIKKKTEDTFYDPNTATKALVDEVYDIVNDRNKGIRIILTAKSADRHNLSDELHEIQIPTLLIWGKEDKVTPATVGVKFSELIPNSNLILMDKDGNIKSVNYNNQMRSQFLNVLFCKVQPLYNALKLFNDIAYGDEYLINLKLQPGKFLF